MRINLHPDGNLRAVLTHLPALIELDLPGPTSVREVLVQAGINPLLVVAVIKNGRPIPKDSLLEEEADLGLAGPLSGG